MTDNRAISNNSQDSPTDKKVITKPPLPVDRGWAWVIMLGVFFNVCFLMFFIRSSSVLFIQFLEVYQESATMTTLAFGLSSAMFAVCNILGPTVLLCRFEVRTLVLVGTVINFLCIFFIAFAPNMIVIDIMMACDGFSHGLIFVPQMTLIGHYFNKRLAFSTAFVNLGLSIGTIAGPPLVQFFLDNYGLRGATMILAGINMNCIPASMLLRPPSDYAEPHVYNMPDDTENVDYNKDQCREIILEESEHESDLECMTEKETAAGHIYKLNDLNSPEEITLMINKPSFTKPSRARSVSESGDKHACNISNEDGLADLANSQVNLKVFRSESIVSDVIDRISMSSSIRYLTDSSIFLEGFVSRDRKSQDKGHLEREESLIDAMNVCEMSPASEEYVVTPVYSEAAEQTSNNNTTCLRRLRKSISESIYVHPLGILLLVASGFGVHTQTCIAYMPAAGKENGLSDSEIPYLVTVIGVCDLVSKLGIGVFADLGYVKRIHISAACAIVCGTAMQFLSFYKGFGLMVLLQVLLGVTVGVTHALLAVIVVDILGVKYMGHIMAGYFLVNGFVMTVEHIIIGSIKDFTGSFFKAYNYIGSLALLSAALFLLEPLVAKIKPAPK